MAPLCSDWVRGGNGEEIEGSMEHSGKKNKVGSRKKKGSRGLKGSEKPMEAEIKKKGSLRRAI